MLLSRIRACDLLVYLSLICFLYYNSARFRARAEQAGLVRMVRPVGVPAPLWSTD